MLSIIIVALLATFSVQRYRHTVQIVQDLAYITYNMYIMEEHHTLINKF